MKRLMTLAVLGAGLSACAVFTPLSPEAQRAADAYGRWNSPGPKTALSMADMIDLGLVRKPSPCEPLVPTCAITPGTTELAQRGAPSAGKLSGPGSQTARNDRRIRYDE